MARSHAQNRLDNDNNQYDNYSENRTNKAHHDVITLSQLQLRPRTHDLYTRYTYTPKQGPLVARLEVAADRDSCFSLPGNCPNSRYNYSYGWKYACKGETFRSSIQGLSEKASTTQPLASLWRHTTPTHCMRLNALSVGRSRHLESGSFEAARYYRIGSGPRCNRHVTKQTHKNGQDLIRKPTFLVRNCPKLLQNSRPPAIKSPIWAMLRSGCNAGRLPSAEPNFTSAQAKRWIRRQCKGVPAPLDRNHVVHTYIHTYIHTYVHTYIHTYIHEYMNT